MNLVCEMGVNKARFALTETDRLMQHSSFQDLEVDKAHPIPSRSEWILKKDYLTNGMDDFSSALNHFKQEYCHESIEAAIFAFSGQLKEAPGMIRSLDWKNETRDIQEVLGAAIPVTFVHEMKAHALALLHDPNLEIEQLNTCPPNEGTKLLLYPETGFGFCIAWANSNVGQRIFSLKMGKTLYAPKDFLDLQFISNLWNEKEKVTWDDVISGPGIKNMYQFLCSIKGMNELDSNISLEYEDAPMIISSNGLLQHDETCERTLNMFINSLCYRTADLALTYGATGGVYLGGKICNQLKSLLNEKSFSKAFAQANLDRPSNNKIPIYLIKNADTALLGAKYLINGTASMQERFLDC